METDLYRLMQNSDDVILASNFTDEIDALAPSAEDAIEYYVVKVLRTFKGSHKVGDLVTYTLPGGGVYCGPKPLRGSAVNSERLRQPVAPTGERLASKDHSFFSCVAAGAKKPS